MALIDDVIQLVSSADSLYHPFELALASLPLVTWVKNRLNERMNRTLSYESCANSDNNIHK